MKTLLCACVLVSAALLPVTTSFAQQGRATNKTQPPATEQRGRARDRASERESLTDEEKESEYAPKKNAFTVGAHIYTNGVAFDFQYRRQIFPRYELLTATSIGSFKDLAEARRPSINYSVFGREYIQDKRNFLYPWFLGAGVQRILIPRTEFSRVQFKMGATLGPVMGILKPYLVDIVVPIGGNLAQLQAVQNSASVSPRDIFGEADWFQGFDRITTVWGMRYRIEASLDLSGSSWFVRAVQMGMQWDVYGRTVPIMDSQPNRSSYFSVFLGINVGDSW